MTSNFSFVARINRSSDLKKITSILTHNKCNINKVVFNSKIDTNIVFFEIDNNTLVLQDELKKSGFMLTSIQEPIFIKLKIDTAGHRNPVAKILSRAAKSDVTLSFIEYDNNDQYKKDQMILMLNAEDSQNIKTFLDYLKLKFRLSIVEYTPSDDDLGSTIFYINYANKLRKFTGWQDDKLIISFLTEINEIAFNLKKLGYDPEDVLMKIYENGEILLKTSGKNFYAEHQMLQVTPQTTLHCFQPPCGGNVYILDSPDETLMIDTGYGIYHDDIMEMLRSFDLWQDDKPKKLFVSHGDSDHCGGAGYLNMVPYSYPGTIDLIRSGNRAYNSINSDSRLEHIYTTMIGAFSRWLPPKQQLDFEKADLDEIGAFPVIGQLNACGLNFYVLKSHGGHQYGQLFLLEPDHNILFTADSMLNMKSISRERARYNQLADLFLTSVNVDRDLAKKEREDLTAIAESYMKKSKAKFYICCGHGAISSLRNGKLASAIESHHYGMSK